MFLNISYGDWLQSFASVIGAMIAIGGVYWQVDKTIKNQKQRDIESSRGIFVIESIGTAEIGDEIYYEKPNE